MKKWYLFALLPLLWGACSTEAALQQALSLQAEALVFLGCKALPEGRVSFSFSAPVTVAQAYFDPPVDYVIESEGEEVTFCLEGGPGGGEKVSADILAVDSRGSTLNVLLSFRTLNERLPKLLINEIRTKNSNMSKENPKTEFIEFVALSAGNLGALRVWAAGSNKGKGLAGPIYEFPPVEVAAGEYIVLHARTLASQSGCADETGTNLKASGGYEATAARDFWIPGSDSRLHSTDAVYITDQNDAVLDAVVLCEKADAWKNDIPKAAAMLDRQGAWKGSGAEQAVPASGASPTRTVNRKNGEDTDSAADWYVGAKSNASPGEPNK